LLRVILQFVNATLHITCWTQEFLQNIHWELLKHPRCCLGSWSSTCENAISIVLRKWKGLFVMVSNLWVWFLLWRNF
jgi:hypothetical protein